MLKKLELEEGQNIGRKNIGASYYIVVAILYLFYRLGYAEIDAVDCSIGAYSIDGSGQDTTTASLYIC